MSWSPLLPVLLLAAAMPAALALYVYRSRSTRGTLLLALVLIAMSEWALAYALEVSAGDPGARLLWANVKLVGALSLPSLWLALAVYNTGRTGWLNRRNLVLLTIPPVLMLGLVWTGALQSGSGLWVVVAWCHGLVLVGAAVLVSNIFSTQRLYRRQSAVLLLVALAPWAANASHLAEFGAHPDPTPFTFPLTVAVLAWGIWRYRLLDIVPVDRGHAIEGMTDGVIVLDSRNRILDLNPAAERILGRSSSQAVGQNVSRLVSNRTGWLIEGRRRSDLAGNYQDEGKEYAEVSIGEGEERRHYGLVLSPLGEASDPRSNRLLLLRDITERKRAEGHLDRMAHYDALTKLPNRRLLQDRLQQAIALARRRKTKVALLFLDLDRFKQVNDTLGHDVGDMLLVQAAERLTGFLTSRFKHPGHSLGELLRVIFFDAGSNT